MIEAVETWIQANQLLKKHATVLVGVSGGPDSVALLHILNRLKHEWDIKLVALTVDHQLRGPISTADADFVEKLCREWEIPFERGIVDVKTYKKERGIGTQVAARELRYRFFHTQMEKHQAQYLALGHHADDQAETMLMQFVRSADPSALAGMPVKRPFAKGFLIRPLLGLSKDALVSYCKSIEVMPRIDASNEETDYTRNYFRKHVIPLLKQKNPNILLTLQRLSEGLRDDELYLREAAEKQFNQIVEIDEKLTHAAFDIAVFKSCPIALQRRMYHLILNYLYNNLPDKLSHVHQKQFFSLISSEKSNQSIDFPEGLQLVKTYERAAFVFRHNTGVAPYDYALKVPGMVELPDGGRVEALYADQPSTDTYICSIVTGTVELPLTVRTRRDGDRMTWQGLKGTRKLKDIFIDEKIPRADRETWPVIVAASGEILWLPGLRKSRGYETGKESYICLKYIK